MISEELLAILVCPACRTKLSLVGSWLVCPNESCARKYPIIDDIPNLLIEEGNKYIHVAVNDLPANPR
ncbi:MAG: Trm112 family protein [Anaerolineales bacterium]